MASKTVQVVIVGSSSSAQAAFAKTAAAANTMAGRIGTTMASIGTRMSTIGRSMTRYVTLPIVAAGGIATHMALDFEAAFTKIAAGSNASATEIAKWKEQVKGLAVATGRDPAELADALYYLASAGLKTGQVMDVLEASARGAAAGFGNTSDIARLTANVLNAYAGSGIKAADVTDILAAAVKEGTADTSEYAGAMGKILPIASKAGVGFDEVAASLASLSNIGLDVNEGVTAMRGLLSALEAPTSAAAEAMKKAGISADEMRDVISEQGLLGALRLLEEATGGDIDKMRAIVPNIRALTGVFGLTEQKADKVTASFDRVTDSTGEMDKAFRTTKEGAAFAFQKAIAQLRVAAIDLGEQIIPILVNDVIPAVQGAIKWFDDLAPSTKALALKLAFFAACAGPLLRVAGALLKAGGAVFKFGAWVAGSNLATGLSGIGGAAAVAGEEAGVAATGGFAALIGALGTLASIAAPAWIAWDSFKTNVVGSSDEVKDATNAWVDALITGMQDGTTAAGWFQEAWGGLSEEQLDSIRNSDKLGIVLQRLAGAYKTGALSAEQYADAAETMGQSSSWVKDQLDNMTVSAKSLRGKIDTLKASLNVYGIKLSDAQQFTVDNYIATGNLRGALDLLRGIVQKAGGPIKMHADAEKRAAGEADTWGHKSDFATGMLKNLDGAAKAGRGPIDALTRSVGFLLGPLATYAQNASAAADAQRSLNSAADAWHGVTSFFGGSGSSGGGTSSTSTGMVPRPLLTPLSPRPIPVILRIENKIQNRLDRRQFARELNWEYSSRGW